MVAFTTKRVPIFAGLNHASLSIFHFSLKIMKNITNMSSLIYCKIHYTYTRIRFAYNTIFSMFMYRCGWCRQTFRTAYEYLCVPPGHCCPPAHGLLQLLFLNGGNVRPGCGGGWRSALNGGFFFWRITRVCRSPSPSSYTPGALRRKETRTCCVSTHARIVACVSETSRNRTTNYTTVSIAYIIMA